MTIFSSSVPRWKLLAIASCIVPTLGACDRQPTGADPRSSATLEREPLRHSGSLDGPWPMESVTGALLFERGCWVVTSGPNRIALFFPRESRLVEGGDIQLGPRRLREGQTYKFVGDLSETAVDKLPTCNGLPSSMGVGDVWPPQPDPPPRKDSLTL